MLELWFFFFFFSFPVFLETFHGLEAIFVKEFPKMNSIALEKWFWVVNGLKKDETNARSTVDNSSSNTPLPLNRGSGVLVSTVGKGANEEVDGVRKEKERLTTDHQPPGIYFYLCHS